MDRVGIPAGASIGLNPLEDAWWAMAVLDLDGVLVAANRSFAELFGLDPVEVVGQAFFELSVADGLHLERTTLDRLLAGDGHIERLPRRLDQPDGSPWEGTVLVSLIRDTDGRPDRVHLRYTEATVRPPAPPIADRPGDFPLALDEMRVGVAIMGLDGVALRANRALCEITGRTEEELCSIDLLTISHPDDREDDIRLGTQAWLGETDSYSIEKRMIRPDGTIVWVRQEVTFVRDESGELAHLVGQVIDITDRKRVELELARSRQEMVDLIDRLPIGLLKSGADGRIVTANPAAASIAGVDAMPPGFDVTTVLHPEDLPWLARFMRDRVAAAEDFHVEFRVLRPDGTERWIRNDAHPDIAPDGSFAGISGTWLDVTDLRAADERLRRQASHDDLTGLPNRRHVFESLGRAVVRCGAGDRRLSVLFVDLDGFKAVNDGHGHVVGDMVLAAVAGRLAAIGSGSGDVVGRVGGDEFLLLSEAIPDRAEAPEDLADRIIAALLEPFDVEGDQVRIGASVGIAEWRHGVSADDLVAAADDAVYEAKRRGRGRWHHA